MKNETIINEDFECQNEYFSFSITLSINVVRKLSKTRYVLL